MTETVTGAQNVLVAGYGNPLRGDDGAGWWVARRLEAWLAARPALGATVRVVSGQQAVPEWAPLLSGADVAYLVDAEAMKDTEDTEDTSATPARPARFAVRCLNPDGAPAGARLVDGHAVGAEGLLAMARGLFGHAPETYLVTIPAVSFEFTEHLSPVTLTAARRAVEWIEEQLAAIVQADAQGAPSSETSPEPVGVAPCA